MSLKVDIKRSVESFSLECSFEAEGGITALFGPSGSGKTMLLDAISGLTSPDEGSIHLGDQTLYATTERINLAPEKRRIAYVFQQPRLFPHLNVEANLQYGTRFTPDDATPISFSDVVDVLGIRPLLVRKTHALSGGEAQRVAIGRALMTSPRLILMDEPLASLDPARRLELMPFIEDLRDRFEIPIIYVSHALDEVIRLADNVVLINEGRKIAEGGTEELLNRADVKPLLGLTDKAQAITAPITILNCKLTEHDRAFGLSRLHAQGLDFWVPRLERPIGSRMRLQVRASDVALASSEPVDTSVLNRFKGTIATIDAAHDGYADVEIHTAEGGTLWSRVTQKSAMKLELETGHDIWAMVKSVAVAKGTAEPALRQPVSHKSET